MKEKFDKGIDEELLKNDFAYYDHWGYGPISGYPTRHEYYSLKLMRHDYGYWLIVSCHASGKNPKMNIGSSNSAKDIIAIRDSFKKLW